MSEISNSSDSRRRGLLDVQARLAAQAEAVARLPGAGVDDSIVAALQAGIETLRWFGTYEAYISQRGDVPLIDLAGRDTVESYIDLSLFLEDLVADMAAHPSEAGKRADDVATVLDDAVAVLRELGGAKSLPQEFVDPISGRYVATTTTLNSFRLWLRTRGAVEKIEEAADSQAEAAGEESEQSLSTEFEALATAERRTSNVFRGLTIALFLIVIGYAAIVALVVAATPSVELAQKLAVGVPVLLLAGYFSREATHHRKTAQWASVLGVQLRSVRAYTVSMSPDDTSEIRLALGRRAFLETPDTSNAEAEPGASSAGGLPDAGTIREITELVRTAATTTTKS